MKLLNCIATLCFLFLSCAHLNLASYVVRMQQDRPVYKPPSRVQPPHTKTDSAAPVAAPVAAGVGAGAGVSAGASAAARLTFASYYNDHMVLQQAPQQAVVWGTYPDIGDRIIIKVSGPNKTYTHGADVVPGPYSDVGVWTVTLDPIPAGGPYTIDAYADDGSRIAITDILFGDVWVCSGQSNMQFSTDQIFNATEELKEASHYKEIRLFTVAMEMAYTPVPDLIRVAEYWSLPNATTVGKSPFTYFSAVCWLFGKRVYKERGYPIGLIDTTWGGTPVEAWSSPDALAKCGVKDSQGESRTAEDYTPQNGPDSNTVLWNAMVYPLLNLTIYGAIWYQGEADSGSAVMRNRYNCTFPAMIDDWRLKFSAASRQTKPDFPFGFVQLSGNSPDMSITVGFPDIRWHQTADYGYVPNPRLKNVFMSVAMDLPDFTSPWGSIHPRDKQDVAARLFLSAMPVAYDPQLPLVEGPRPRRVIKQGETIVLDYDIGKGAVIKVLNREGFEFCCTFSTDLTCSSKSAWWLPTPVLTSNTTAIVLDGTVCGPGQSVVGVRYAWRESPCVFKRCAVYSYAHDDLPGPPFVTVKPNRSVHKLSYDIDWSKPQLIPQ